MRMRQLGKTHSVSFFASAEVASKIRERMVGSADRIETKDVLLWTLHETCEQIKENGTLWASQGLNFANRAETWDQYYRGDLDLSGLQTRIREREAQTLEELYGMSELEPHTHLQSPNSDFARAIEQRCREFQITSLSSTNLLEEQERELAHEKENEREVERILGATPIKHRFDPFLTDFVRAGVMPKRVTTLAGCLANTSIIEQLRDISYTFFQTPEIKATKDFALTVKPLDVVTTGFMDDYLRPVQWILTSLHHPGTYLLISPYEANILLPEVRSSRTAFLHLYSTRITLHGPSFEKLDFFTSPSRTSVSITPATIQELNIFAGQTFFRDKKAFQLVCSMLGLHLGEIPAHLQGQIDIDGFVENDEVRRELSVDGCVFQASPVRWVHILMTLRAKAQGFGLTHMGQILQGNNLHDSEFELNEAL